MDDVPVLLYCPKPCCKLLFSDLPSTVPYWNYCQSFMCKYNRNAYNVTFCIFSCRALNNFYKLLSYVMRNTNIDLIINIMSKRPVLLPKF